MSPGAAAAIGVAVGAAAVGIAGAAVLANKQGRKKVEKFIDDAKDKAGDIKEDVADKFAEGKEKVGKVVEVVKDASQDVAKAVK